MTGKRKTETEIERICGDGVLMISCKCSAVYPCTPHIGGQVCHYCGDMPDINQLYLDYSARIIEGIRLATRGIRGRNDSFGNETLPGH